MGLMLTRRLEEAAKSLPVCSISDVKIKYDENRIVLDFEEVLDKYYFLDHELNFPSDLDWAQIREMMSEDERCWDDFLLDFMGVCQGWIEEIAESMPKKLLDDFLAINRSVRPIFHITKEQNSLFFIWNYSENIYEIAYPHRSEVKYIASGFSLEEILAFLPQEKKRIEADNIALRISGDHWTTETPEAKKLRAKFKRELKKRSAALFKELADILISSLPSFLERIPGLLARNLVLHDLDKP